MYRITTLCETEFIFYFFGIFCIGQLLNTILTTVYIDLNSLSYGKYKEAKCHIQSIWFKTSRLKIFFFTSLGRYNEILILVF